MLARIWTFTAYRDPKDGINEAYQLGHCTYSVWQEEICPTTQRRHWQGYIELDRRRSQGDVKRIIGGEPHVERARSPERAREYCTKEDTRAPGAEPVEVGEFRGRQQGRRTDLEAAAELAVGVGGITAAAIAFPATYIRYHRGLAALASVTLAPRVSSTPGPIVEVYIGASGTGKTRSVYHSFGDSEVFSKDGSKWWDGYRGQRCIVFDDFAGSPDIPPVQLLKICDRYPLSVETKGGVDTVKSENNTYYIHKHTRVCGLVWRKRCLEAPARTDAQTHRRVVA